MSTATVAAPQQPQPAAPADMLALADVQAAAVLLLELEAVYAVTSPLRRALEGLRRTVNGRTLMARGGRPVDVAAIRQELEQLTADTLPAHLEQVVTQWAEKATSLGVRNVAEQIGGPLERAAVRSDPAVQRAIRSSAASARSHAAQATKLLDRGGVEQLPAVLSRAQQAVTALETGTTWAVNRAANDVPQQVAKRHRYELLWVAERDACVVCQALAGHIADPFTGQGFDETATFGTSPAPDIWPPGMPLMRPPRHPRCRCQCVVWLGSAQPDLPSALQREAKRSVLKGWSQPSESNAARLRAAQKLLANGGGGLPKSVQAEARVAVRRGRFTSRTVPTGTAARGVTHE